MYFEENGQMLKFQLFRQQPLLCTIEVH